MELISGYICKLAATYTSMIPGLKFVAKTNIIVFEKIFIYLSVHNVKNFRL